MGWGTGVAEDYNSTDVVQEDDYREIYIPQTRSGARKAGIRLDLPPDSRAPSLSWLPTALWIFAVAAILVVLIWNPEFVKAFTRTVAVLTGNQR